MLESRKGREKSLFGFSRKPKYGGRDTTLLLRWKVKVREGQGRDGHSPEHGITRNWFYNPFEYFVQNHFKLSAPLCLKPFDLFSFTINVSMGDEFVGWLVGGICVDLEGTSLIARIKAGDRKVIVWL